MEAAVYLPCLQGLSLALAGAVTAEEVADALFMEGLSVLRPVGGSVCLVSEEGIDLEVVRVVGDVLFAGGEQHRFPMDAPIPQAAAVRQGEPIWLDSAAEWEWEDTQDDALGQGALAAVPLRVQERVLGVLDVAFTVSGPLRDEVRLFLETVVQMGALAFDRVRLYEAERLAREMAERHQETLVAELRGNENRARDFFGNLTDGFLACGREGQILFANEVAAASFRLPLDELAGKILWEIFPAYLDSEFALVCHQVMEDAVPVHREDYWARYDVWFENHIFPTDTGIAILFRDITERKQTELFQQTISDLFLRLANITDTDILLDAVVTTVTSALRADGCAMTGVDVAEDQSEILRRYADAQFTPTGTYALSDFLTPEAITAYQHGKTRVVMDAVADSMTGPIYETRYRLLNMRAFVSVPFVRGEQWVGTLTAFMNRARVWRSQEIAFVEAAAERAWLSLENVRLFQAERERSHQLSLAISEVHHRVKNSLQAVSALLEMQITPDSTLLPVEAVEDSLSQIKTIALVHDLLARDKPMGGVNVAQVLTNLTSLLSRGMRIGKQGLPIRVEAEPVWISTKAATSLALAVNELLTNAAKHNELIEREGTCHDAIEIRLQRQNGQISVTVEDHGPGFAPDFDPVRDAHVGLELVLMLVEHDLRGTITFSNRPGSGDGESTGGRVEVTFSEETLPE